MILNLNKKLNKKGFTLAELLIVVAIIAILVAIAVPVFSAQLENSREAVDRANARTASSLAVADALMNHPGVTTEIAYGFATDASDNLGISTCSTSTDTVTCSGVSVEGGTAVTGKSKVCSKAGTLSVKVTNGVVTANNWLTALDS